MYDRGRTIQIGVFQLASRLAIDQNEFVSRGCSLGKLCLGVSKDTGSSDSLRKVLVQRVSPCVARHGTETVGKFAVECRYIRFLLSY